MPKRRKIIVNRERIVFGRRRAKARGVEFVIEMRKEALHMREIRSALVYVKPLEEIAEFMLGNHIYALKVDNA